MKALSRLYRPVTGTPFQQDETYREAVPCAALAPYIRCFWGSEGPQRDRPGPGGIVIPDTCMDIIFRIDHVRHRVTADFCALDETSLLTPPSDGQSGGFSATFAIRFYAWTACEAPPTVSIRRSSSSGASSARCPPSCRTPIP